MAGWEAELDKKQMENKMIKNEERQTYCWEGPAKHMLCNARCEKGGKVRQEYGVKTWCL